MTAVRILGSVAMLLLAISVIEAGDGCPSDQNMVVGVVLGRSGQPLRDTRVHVLLDRVSKKQTMKQGFRARSTRTDASGRFELLIPCGKHEGLPNPCAAKPRHLTLIVGDLSTSLSLHQFKLSSIEMQRMDGGCLIHAPQLKLSSHP